MLTKLIFIIIRNKSVKCSSYRLHYIAISRVGHCSGLSIIRNLNLENGSFDRNVVYTDIFER